MEYQYTAQILLLPEPQPKYLVLSPPKKPLPNNCVVRKHVSLSTRF